MADHHPPDPESPALGGRRSGSPPAADPPRPDGRPGDAARRPGAAAPARHTAPAPPPPSPEGTPEAGAWAGTAQPEPAPPPPGSSAALAAPAGTPGAAPPPDAPAAAPPETTGPLPGVQLPGLTAPVPGAALRAAAAPVAARTAQAARRTEPQPESLPRARPAVRAAPLAIPDALVPPGTPPAERPAGPRRPIAPRRPWMVGPVHIGQLVVWQLAVAAVVSVAGEQPAVLIPVAAGALAALVLTAGRVRGRWLHEWAATWLRFRARRRRSPLTGDARQRATAVLGSLPGRAQLDVIEVDDGPCSVISSPGGLSAVLQVRLADVDEAAGAAVLLPSLTALLPAADGPEGEVAVQVLMHSVPAPLPALGDSPAALSYRELTGGRLAARRRTRLVLQALRTPEAPADSDLHPTLVASIHRVQRRLRLAGMSGTPLTPEQLAGDVLGLLGADAAATAPAAAIEQWSGWELAGVRHTTHALSRWPDLADPRGQYVAEQLLDAATLGTTVSLAARRLGAEEIELEGAVRTAVPASGPGAAGAAASGRELAEAAQRSGALLLRMDGDQALGVASTLPLGGFVR